MSKIIYITVKRYAELWEKTESTIYKRVSAGKLTVVPEPGGGQGKLIPVCNCDDNYFPGRDLCQKCQKSLNHLEK